MIDYNTAWKASSYHDNSVPPNGDHSPMWCVEDEDGNSVCYCQLNKPLAEYIAAMHNDNRDRVDGGNFP